MDIQCWDGFVPPFGFRRHIQRALSCLDQADLEGIEYVLLLDDVPEISRYRDPELDRVVKDGLLVFGAYSAKTATTPSHINLIARSLYHPMPRIFVHTPAMTLRIAETVAHEVGHHLIAEKRFSLRVKKGSYYADSSEEFAERYASFMTLKMQQKWLYRLGATLLKAAAEINYFRGARAWRKKNYSDAAKYFDRAMQVRDDHAKASHWFRRARERTTL